MTKEPFLSFNYQLHVNPYETKRSNIRWPASVWKAIEDQGLYVSEVAKNVGLSPRKLLHFLEGKKTLSDAEYKKLVDYLGLKTIAFSQNKDKPFPKIDWSGIDNKEVIYDHA